MEAAGSLRCVRLTHTEIHRVQSSGGGVRRPRVLGGDLAGGVAAGQIRWEILELEDGTLKPLALNPPRDGSHAPRGSVRREDTSK